MTPEEMYARLVVAPPPPLDLDDPDGESYGQAIEYVGRLVVQAYERNPDLREYPIDTEYDWQAIEADDPRMEHPERWAAHLLHVGLLDEMERRGFHLKGFGLSGNQVYEGVGAARFALGLGDLGNPAIVEVST